MRSSAAALILLAAIGVLGAGCAEREAEVLFEDAARLAKQGRYDEAIGAFREVERRYPRTEFARQAGREVKSLHDLMDAGKRYRTDRAVEMVRTATRAVEQFRVDQGRWPGRLDELVPRWLERVETDPWGRPVRYERTAGGYRVLCLGADGTAGGTGDDQDVIVENGEFRVGKEATGA